MICYRLKTDCHPEASGRRPEHGEMQWTMTFTLQDGSRLELMTGKKGRDAMLSMLAQEEADDRMDTGTHEPSEN